MKVWTFTFLGGDAFGLAIPGNPPLRHDGGRTIQPVYGTQEAAQAVQEQAEGYGCTVKVTCQGEPPEAAEERAALLAMQRGDEVYPSIKCPTCFWFDLTSAGHCGLDPDHGWFPEEVAAGRESEVGAQCEADCPVPDRVPF
jgi:hypothetical protein